MNFRIARNTDSPKGRGGDNSVYTIIDHIGNLMDKYHHLHHYYTCKTCHEDPEAVIIENPCG
jgi:hypothetical protein